MADNQEQNFNDEEYSDSLYGEENKKSKIKIILIGLILVLVVAVAGSFIFWRGNKEPVKKVAENASTQTNNSIQPAQTISDTERAKVDALLAQYADDKDRDGLSVQKETELGTSDNDSDTDWDGLSDKDEIEKWGTDPLKSDTDDDGYGDGVEVNGGFNPKGSGKL